MVHESKKTMKIFFSAYSTVTRANFGNCHSASHRQPERLKYEYLQQNLLSLEIAKSEISQLSFRLKSVGDKMRIKYSLNFNGGRHKGQLICILSVTESKSKEGLLQKTDVKTEMF